MGNVSLLQAFFKLSGRQAEASWDSIVKVGLRCVLEELENKSWQSACLLLKNMVQV